MPPETMNVIATVSTDVQIDVSRAHRDEPVVRRLRHAMSDEACHHAQQPPRASLAVSHPNVWTRFPWSVPESSSGSDPGSEQGAYTRAASRTFEMRESPNGRLTDLRRFHDRADAAPFRATSAPARLALPVKPAVPRSPSRSSQAHSSRRRG